MRRSIFVVIAFVLLAVLSVGAFALTRRTADRPAALAGAAPPPVPVVAEPVKSGDMQIFHAAEYVAAGVLSLARSLALGTSRDGR